MFYVFSDGVPLFCEFSLFISDDSCAMLCNDSVDASGSVHQTHVAFSFWNPLRAYTFLDHILFAASLGADLVGATSACATLVTLIVFRLIFDQKPSQNSHRVRLVHVVQSGAISHSADFSNSADKKQRVALWARAGK